MQERRRFPWGAVWTISFLLSYLAFSTYVSIRLGEVKQLKIQMRWIERNFDQGNLLVLNEETLEDMKEHGFSVEPMIIRFPTEGE